MALDSSSDEGTDVLLVVPQCFPDTHFILEPLAARLASTGGKHGDEDMEGNRASPGRVCALLILFTGNRAACNQVPKTADGDGPMEVDSDDGKFHSREIKVLANSDNGRSCRTHSI